MTESTKTFQLLVLIAFLGFSFAWEPAVLPLDGSFVYETNWTEAICDTCPSYYEGDWQFPVAKIPVNGFIELRMYPIVGATPNFFNNLHISSYILGRSGAIDSNTGLHKINFFVRYNSSWPANASVEIIGTDGNMQNLGFALKACIGYCNDTCPSDCMSNGFCNVTSGVCSCPGNATEYDQKTCEDIRPSPFEGFWDALVDLFLTLLAWFIFICILFAAAIFVCVYLCCRRRRQRQLFLVNGVYQPVSNGTSVNA